MMQPIGQNILMVDSHLKAYFIVMIKNKSISIQFTPGKILEIVEKDLGIKFNHPKSLYAQVCIEAFAFYMQIWPDWNLAIKYSANVDFYYRNLASFLRSKLLSLKIRDDVIKSTNGNVVDIPESANNLINNSNNGNKVLSPFVLNVSVPRKLWISTELAFQNYDSSNIFLKFNEVTPLTYELDLKEVFNYPFVRCKLFIPDMCCFTRSTPFLTERFIQTKTDPLISNSKNGIISIDSDGRSAYNVYSRDVLQMFFIKLLDVLRILNNKIPDILLKQISIISRTFLLDLSDTDLTACEGSTVSFNIGGSKYYTQKEMGVFNELEEKVAFTTILTPVVSYYFMRGFKESDITPNKITSFDFLNGNEENVNQFTKSIKMTYECVLCDIPLALNELKTHLQNVHPIESTMKCTKCFQPFCLRELINSRWKHNCAV